MGGLEILRYPDPRLLIRSVPVKTVDDSVRELIDKMFYTMYEASGIGLAAPQVNVRNRIMVVDVSERRDEPLVFVNPAILSRDGVQESVEGCLSVPGFGETVRRAARVEVEAWNRKGEPFSLGAEGLLSVCIQHEVDHLNGILFVDRISRLRRERIKDKIRKTTKRK